MKRDIWPIGTPWWTYRTEKDEEERMSEENTHFILPIKLRAWDKVNKKMINSPMACTSSWVMFTAEIEGLDCGNAIHPIQQYEIAQYIGYQDKNGKEVYAGDILQDPLGQQAQVVAFCDTSHVLSGFTLRGIGKKSLLAGFEVFMVSWLVSAEIVGNIYETPIVEVP